MWDILKVIAAVGGVILTMVLLVIELRQKRQSAQAWQECADETGLLYEEGDEGKKELRGNYRGYRVRVWVRVMIVGSGRNRYAEYYTEIAVVAQEEALGSVQLARRTRDELPKHLRKKPWTFATAFELGGDEFGREVFRDEAVQASFMRLIASGGDVLYGAGRLMREVGGQITTRDELMRYIDTTVDAVERLDITARRQLQVAEEVEEGVVSSEIW